jgi:hypothetical protein
MEVRKKELAKLTVTELRALINPPPAKGKKKAELIDMILAKLFAESDKEEIKRVKIAPVFAMAKASNVASASCGLCDGQGSLWCELGEARCPLCSKDTEVCVLPSPSVKQERGVTSVPYEFAPDGKIILKIKPGIDPEKLISLVTVYGFGICESLEALSAEHTIENATEFLMGRIRDSAENSSIAEAQLNSEHVREEIRESKKRSQKEAREAVKQDLSVLLELDNLFCSTYMFSDLPNDGGRLLAWVLESSDNRVLLFDYLGLKRDSVGWYKKHAASFFDKAESHFLLDQAGGNVQAWIADMNMQVTDALFNLPETGGSIPALFRETVGTPDENMTGNAEVLIIEEKTQDTQVSQRNVVLLE